MGPGLGLIAGMYTFVVDTDSSMMTMFADEILDGVRRTVQNDDASASLTMMRVRVRAAYVQRLVECSSLEARRNRTTVAAHRTLSRDVYR